MANIISEIRPITNELIVDMIHEIRGQKVMLDFELAELYGYDTKTFNQQINRNIEKFPPDFIFRLSKEEITSLMRWKNSTTYCL